MKVLTPGHRYQLNHFEAPNTFQVLQFIEKQGPEPLRTINDGTTNEEVLAMLIDRLRFLQAKFPCRENAIALTHFETGLMWLNERTKERQTRGVEGTHQP